MMKASAWFTDVAEFRRLCLDARSEAKSESAEEFTHEMLLKANEYGLETFLSEKQLHWLCNLADWVAPKRIL